MGAADQTHGVADQPQRQHPPLNRRASPNRYVDAFFDARSSHHWSSSAATTRWAGMNTVAWRLHMGRWSRSKVSAGRSHIAHV